MHVSGEGEFSPLSMIAVVGDALKEMVREDILRNDCEGHAAFKQQYRLARQLYEKHRELFDSTCDHAGLNAVRHLVDGSLSAQEVIRYELEQVHELPMHGISDLEIARFGLRVRARLRDFANAKRRGRRKVDELRQRIARGRYGEQEHRVLVHRTLSDGDPSRAPVIRLADIRRAR